MKSKGFTLIELLAVIVILAIIALIAVPIVLNIINNSKKESVKISVEHYLDAVNNAVAKEYLNDPTINLDGEYEIKDEGKKIISEIREINIEYKGEKVESGTIIIGDGKVTSAEDVKINKYYATLESDQITLSDKVKEAPGLYKPDGTFVPWNDLVSGSSPILPLSDDGKTINMSNRSKISSLTGRLVIPDTVTTIGENAFLYCKDLTIIQLPESISEVVDEFIGCTSLVEFIVDEKNPNFSSENGILYNKDKTTLVRYPEGKTESSLQIRDSVTSIGSYAFINCISLTEVTIPNSVTSIGQGAFNNCDGLTTIVIPDSVTNLGRSAFYLCNNLKSVSIGKNVESIEQAAFSNCTSLESVTIPGNVKSIGKDAFFECRNLTEVIIEDGPTSIGSYAFRDCPKLKTITLPSTLKTIGYEAFLNCEELASIEIPYGVTSIEGSAFRWCSSLPEVVIPDTVTSMGTNVFEYCSSLTKATLSNSLTTISYHTFNGCTNLTEVEIPDSVTKILDYAFSSTGLTEVRIPSTVTSIGGTAFTGVGTIYYSGTAGGRPWGAGQVLPLQ